MSGDSHDGDGGDACGFSGGGNYGACASSGDGCV